MAPGDAQIEIRLGWAGRVWDLRLFHKRVQPDLMGRQIRVAVFLRALQDIDLRTVNLSCEGLVPASGGSAGARLRPAGTGTCLTQNLD